MLFQADREIGGLVRNFRSPFYGELLYNQNYVRMKTTSTHGGPAVVASVVSATSSLYMLLFYIVVSSLSYI